MPDECIVNLSDGSLSSRDTSSTAKPADTKIEYVGEYHTQKNISSPKSMNTGSPKEEPYRLYFKENNADVVPNETRLECTTEYRHPVEVNAANRFTQWTGNTAGLNPGLYYIVIGVSLEKLELSNIESISFCNKNRFPSKVGPLETLNTFPESGPEVLRWGLHNQYVVASASQVKITVDMEIRTRQLSQGHPGVIHLHYMELHSSPFDDHADPSINVSRPYLWSIDVGIKQDPSDIHSPILPVEVIFYSLSGDNNYAATLSCSNKQLQLDMWDLKSDVSQNTLSNPLTPFKPRRVGQYHLPLFKIARQTSQAIMVSLSWNASKVSVVAENESFLKHAFSVFSFDKSLQSPARGKSSSTFNSLTPYDASRLDPKLKTFYGYGRFHMIDVSNPNIEDQLFVTCDKNSVNIYSAHEQWSHLRSIIDGAMAWNPSATMDTVRAKYVSWNSEQGVVYVGDLITGLIVTRRQYSKSTVSRFSRDGSQMIMHHTGFEVSTYWTESGTHINTTDCCLGFPAYFQDESRLILSSVVWDEAFGRGEQGAILDATNMFTVDRIAISTQNYEQQLQSYGPEARKIIALHGSKLSLYRIEDVTIKPYSQPRHSCNDSCFDELTTLSSIDAQAISEGENTQFVASSGLRFRVELRAASTSGWRCGSDLLQSLVIWVTNSEGKSREALIIPPSDLGNILGIWLENRITFNATTQQVIIRSHILLMMWVLPTTFEGDFMLLNAAWTQLCRFQIEDKNDWLWTILSQCTHGQTYLKLQTMDDNNEDVIVDIMNLYCENVFMEAPNHSLEGALALIEIFEISDNVFKRAILQYIGRYINCYSNPKDLSENIVARICQNVTHENQNNYNRFLTALFESPYGRWVPRRDYNERTNPISILLKLTEKVPMAIEVAHTIINYCTRQANLKKDPQFAEILLKPLHDLLDRTQLHTDISLGALRRLAFIPVRGRTFILDHHKIAHPPSWWKFWSKNEPIYKCENPVWQLDRRPLSKPTNLLNDNFTRDIFVASFDMLWRAPKEVVDTRSTVARIKSSTHTPQSWLRTLFNVVLLKCKLAPKSDVELHGFELESYGNPAIVALIEFKWNTIGYAYWLFRFIWQCIYYILVISAVFIQVYSDARNSIVGIFIAIIVLASTFLWFEIIQIIHNPIRYFLSPYNYVDLVVFTLPLVGSALQIVNVVTLHQGNTSTLSFSVLFIFLHFLFELRINRGVCHFVTIILRIISEIRVFFFVFAGGLVAFTIAILHLLRACPVGTCDTSQVGFPSNFYSAFSSTYFFMGGIWDPISDNFNTDDWVFHTMMIIYFFFTTILLLNVLISLINVAFNAGDETWLLVWAENRLRYVESAESMTYHIPGFREAHDWFPKEIYYSATVQEVNDYRARCFKKDGQDFIRSDAATQRLFGQTSPAKKVIEASINNTNNLNENSDNCNCNCNHRNGPAFILPQSSSTTLAQDASELDNPLMASTDQQQQQAAQDLQDLKAQLAEMKQMLSLLCKEKVDKKEE